jgi:ribonuclease HII
MEQNLLSKGYEMVIGIDEAGRGPLAGPVVAAACCLPPSIEIEGILDDSKTLNAQQREALFSQITTNPDIKWAFCIIDVETIDKINILQSTMLAMEGAVDALFMKNGDDSNKIIATTTNNNNATSTGSILNSYLLVDGNRLPSKFDKEHSLAVVKGDSKCRCIAAASIIAKVTRDRLMEELHDQHPQYGFSQHKGYGVAAHVEAIREHGPCVAHRRTFAPVKNWYPLEKKEGKESGGGRKKK